VIGGVCTSRDIKRELIRGFVVHAGRFFRRALRSRPNRTAAAKPNRTDVLSFRAQNDLQSSLFRSLTQE
jgi:hypothetical protein